MARAGTTCLASFALASACVCVAVAAPSTKEDEELIGRVVSALERHYRRAQTLVATETTILQPLTRNMKNQGAARTMVSEVRLEWGVGDASPRTIRSLVTVEGPAVSSAPCYEPRSESHDRLVILLPPRRNLRLTVRGTEAIAGVRTRRIDFDLMTKDTPRADWKGDCGTVQAGISTRGRVWVDPTTGEVLRFSEGLVRSVKVPGPPRSDGGNPRSFTVRRADTSIEFAPVVFTDPDETLLLPSRFDSVLVVTNASLPRLRRTLTFTNYRRYLTGGRVVPE